MTRFIHEMGRVVRSALPALVLIGLFASLFGIAPTASAAPARVAGSAATVQAASRPNMDGASVAFTVTCKARVTPTGSTDPVARVAVTYRNPSRVSVHSVTDVWVYGRVNKTFDRIIPPGKSRTVWLPAAATDRDRDNPVVSTSMAGVDLFGLSVSVRRLCRDYVWMHAPQSTKLSVTTRETCSMVYRRSISGLPCERFSRSAAITSARGSTQVAHLTSYSQTCQGLTRKIGQVAIKPGQTRALHPSTYSRDPRCQIGYIILSGRTPQSAVVAGFPRPREHRLADTSWRRGINYRW